MKFSGVTILQGVEFSIFLLIFEWALQQCSATALPVIKASPLCTTDLQNLVYGAKTSAWLDGFSWNFWTQHDFAYREQCSRVLDDPYLVPVSLAVTHLFLHISFLWPPCVIGPAIYIFILSFVLLLSSFSLSSPNLSGRRLDVCHTSTHGVP